MRIVFIENEDLQINSSGGIATYLSNLVTFCKKNKIETLLVANGLEMNSPACLSLSPQISKSNFRFLLELFTNPKIKLFNKTDILHVQRPEMVIPLYIRTKCKIICTMHGGQDKAVLKKKGIFHWLIYFLLQTISSLMVDCVIAVDNKNMNRYRRYYPWLKNKISMMPIGIDTSKYEKPIISNEISLIKTKYKIPNAYKSIIYLGRLEKEKNVSFLIDVFHEVSKINKSINFIIIGDGSQQKILHDKSKEMNLKNIYFTGSINHDEVHHFLGFADVLVLASLFEGSPTVVKEALICKVPVVSTDVGDVREVLSQVPMGGYISELTVHDFESNIQKALKISKEDIQFDSEIFGLNKMGEATLRLYKKIQDQNEN